MCSFNEGMRELRQRRIAEELVGLPLMRESRVNHLGKLMFQWFYWHVLLPGRDVPGLGSAMPTAGKELTRSGGAR